MFYYLQFKKINYEKDYFFLMFFILMSLTASSQTTKPYTNGSLWQVSFVQVKPGMGNAYLKNLSENWAKAMKQAKTDGLIMDFKVLNGESATKDDWNLMLMIQIKNHAALDGLDDKMEIIRNKMMGDEDAQMKAAISRNDLRQLFGAKLTQELIFK